MEINKFYKNTYNISDEVLKITEDAEKEVEKYAGKCAQSVRV